MQSYQIKRLHSPQRTQLWDLQAPLQLPILCVKPAPHLQLASSEDLGTCLLLDSSQQKRVPISFRLSVTWFVCQWGLTAEDVGSAFPQTWLAFQRWHLPEERTQMTQLPPMNRMCKVGAAIIPRHQVIAILKGANPCKVQDSVQKTEATPVIPSVN